MPKGGDKEVSYGTKGSQSGKCPRCGKGSDTHEITRCDISDAARKGVEALLSSTNAIAGPDGTSDISDRMVGALVATTSTGKEIRLVAASGPAFQFRRAVVGWEQANVAVPTTQNGWMDIYGRTFNLPQDLHNACAAVKLLMTLGRLYNESNSKYKYNRINLYEQAIRGPDTEKTDSRGRAKTGKSNRLQQWKGEGVSFTYVAHSCEQCEKRIPLLLCSNPCD